MNKTILKFKEKYKNEDQIDHVVDFLKAEYGNKKSINFNYEKALEKANLWTKKLNEKNEGLKNYGLVEIIKEFKNGFKIVKLLDQESKDWEGLHMSHCVASYKSHQGIYSLRDKENLPHCTIEIENNEIKQIKGKGNGKVSPKYVDFVLDFLQSLNLELSNGDIKNLGYTNKINFNFIKEYFSNYKIIKIKGEEFLYVGNQLKLIKNFDSKNENLLLHFCEYNQCFDAVKLLVKNGTDIRSDYNYSLRFASANGHLDIAKFLVENGANIHIQNDYALRSASENGHLNVVKFLVENGANIHAQDDYSLIYASLKGHLDVAKFLIKNGADIHSQDDYSLIHASANGHLNVVKFLVENGVNIHTQNDYPLRLASEYGHLEIVKFLVENGADIHAQGDSSLHYSSKNGHLDVVKFLVENDANIHSQNDYPLRLAMEKLKMYKLFFISILIIIDQLTKYLAFYFNVSSLKFNPGLVFGMDSNSFFKLVFPLVVFPILFLFSKNIKNELHKNLYIIFLLSGAISNYIGRFSEKGVIDFLIIPNLIVFNLADVYLFITQIILLISLKEELKLVTKT